jgi:hypothetical protein
MCDKHRVRLLRRQILAGLAFAPSVRADEGSMSARARWLAGLPTTEPGTAEWAAYAKTEDERWVASRARVRAMQEWAAATLASAAPPETSVFYPFGGPDALHAVALFGGARRIVLVGLEPVGELPDPDSRRGVPSGYFSRLGAALADVHRLGFFRTWEMQNDFRADGVLSALVATVVRMGGQVNMVRTNSGDAQAVPGARIDWTTASGDARRLDYWQADLANAGLRARPDVVREVRALAKFVTFVKAASYLLAEPRFAQLRQTILDESVLVVQDDTGIPFRHFGEHWACRLFGRYELPAPPFEERTQLDLQAAFAQRAPSPLPFGVGYHVDARRSNLLVASRTR